MRHSHVSSRFFAALAAATWLTACGASFDAAELRSRQRHTEASLSECVVGLERLGFEMIEKQRLRDGKSHSHLADFREACVRDGQRCGAAAQILLQRGAIDEARALFERACSADAHCTEAGLLSALAGDEADSAALPEAQRARLRRCAAGDGAACWAASGEGRTLHRFLSPRLCVMGVDAACTKFQSNYAAIGDAAFSGVEPSALHHVLPVCDRAGCAAFYEGLAVGAAPDSERRKALSRAACSASNNTGPACAELASLSPNQVDSVWLAARACLDGEQPGACEALTVVFRSRWWQQTEKCKRPVYEKLCFDGDARWCEVLANDLATEGYAVGYDRDYAEKLRSLAKQPSSATR